MRSGSLSAKAMKKMYGLHTVHNLAREKKGILGMVTDWQVDLSGLRLLLYIFEEKCPHQWAQTRWMCSYPVWMRNLKLALPLSSPSSSLSRSVSGLNKYQFVKFVQYSMFLFYFSRCLLGQKFGQISPLHKGKFNKTEEDCIPNLKTK